MGNPMPLQYFSGFRQGACLYLPALNPCSWFPPSHLWFQTMLLSPVTLPPRADQPPFIPQGKPNNLVWNRLWRITTEDRKQLKIGYLIWMLIKLVVLALHEGLDVHYPRWRLQIRHKSGLLSHHLSSPSLCLLLPPFPQWWALRLTQRTPKFSQKSCKTILGLSLTQRHPYK